MFRPPTEIGQLIRRILLVIVVLELAIKRTLEARNNSSPLCRGRTDTSTLSVFEVCLETRVLPVSWKSY